MSDRLIGLLIGLGFVGVFYFLLIWFAKDTTTSNGRVIHWGFWNTAKEALLINDITAFIKAVIRRFKK